MPDFDKNLKPVLKNEQDSLPRLDNPASTGRAAYVQSLAGEVNILDKFFGRGPVESPIAPTVTSKELYDNRRYGVYSADIVDIEDQKAYAQTFAEKSANGILKGLNLTATTFAGGFGMLYGLGSSAFSGRLADVWDNPGLRALDEWNTKVDQEYLPNYYTNVEKEANWYSTDNWFKANFLFDKLIKNSGYAVGAMLSGNVANAGVKVAGAAIGRAAAALESANSFKLFTPLLRNTSRAFSVGKNVEAASILEGEISSIADLSSKSSRLAEIAAETNMFGQLNSLGRRTAIAAYSSAGEASFEALQTAKEYKENLINQYVKANGYEPSGEELKSIEAEAESVGKTSFFGNLAILGATEYVQLPRLLGSSYAADKQAANSLLGQVDDVALKDGKYVRVEPRTKFGRLSDKVTGVGKYVADPKEGLQEGLQYALQVGTQNYYNKAYQTDAANVWTDGLLYGLVGVKDGEGVGALTSKEGAESILLGAVTGGLMQARNNFQESRTLTDNTNRFLNILNGAPSFKDAYVDKLNSVNRAVILQQQQQQAVVQGNKLEAKDLDADLMHNYLVSRIKYGRLDMVLDEIKDLKREGISEGGLSQLKEQGLANINDTVESYQQRLDTLENTAKNTGEIYKALDLRYSGLVNREGERTYPPMVIDKMAYAAAKIADYDLRIPKMNGALADAGILTVDVLQSIIKENKANKEATDAALLQINELDVTSEIKDELKTALSDVVELSLRRKLFMQEYDDIKENPQEYLGAPGFGFGDSEEMPVTVDQEVIEKKKKKIVSKELKVGKLYSLEQPIYKQGNELVVAPKLAVVSQTLGGELEVRLPNGDISFFTPEEFKQFKISDQESPSEDIEHIMNNAIDNVLKTAKFSGIEKPTGDDKLAYINSLDNPELTDAVFEQYTKTAEGYFKKKAKDDKIKKGNASILNEQKGDPEPEKPVVEAADYNQVNRKTKLVLPRATVATPQIPGYKNSIEFGANLYKFENRKQIRGVYVTQANESQLGLGGEIVNGKYVGGLMNHLKGTSDVDPKKTIAVVMVEQIGNTIKVVGVDGKTLDNPTFDTAVFQVMPDPKFQWSEKFGGKSMFPEGTTDKEEKNAIIKEYTEFVNETLDSTDLSPFQVEASFGVPQRVTDSEGNEVKNARTGVVASGLIKASDLATRAVIYVPTLEDVAQKGSTYYSNARGKIFLDAGNGYVPLQNKLHSEKEANTIYQVIDRLANIKYEEGDFNSPEAKRLFNWLRSVTYWGTPKNSPGVNSVWFAESGLLDLRLNMSNDGTNFTFTPVSIEANKDAIIAKLQGMYNNVRSAYVTDELSNWNQPYEEILSVDKDGNLKTKQWKNYQSYLLSSEGRTGEETPLTVPYKEASSATSNREGIYFVNTDSKAKYAGIIEKANVAKKEILTPIAPSPTAGFVLDGQTPNTIKNPQYGDIVFTVNGEELTKTGGKAGVALVADQNGKLVSQPAIDKLAKEKNLSIEKATQLLASSIYQKLTVPAAAPVAQPTAPPTSASVVSDIEAKKADVVLTIGTSGSGKSTWINSVNKNNQFAVISPDEMRIEFTGDINNKSKDKEIYKEAAKRAIQSIKDGKPVIFDTTNLTKEKRRPFIEAIRKELPNANIQYKLMPLNAELAKQRIKSDIAAGVSRANVSEETIDRHAASYKQMLKDIKEESIINYDAELAALESDETEITPSDEDLIRQQMNDMGDDAPFRVKVQQDTDKFEKEDWPKIEEFMKNNFPMIPLYRVKNIIRGLGGIEAWGMLKNGGIYVYENAEVGTAYHEVFEAVWKLFSSPEEKINITNEFRNRAGSFVDRMTGETVKYSEATDFQLKEQLAEEFRDFVKDGKVPMKPAKGQPFIVKLFNDIVRFIKTFFVGPQVARNTEELFKRMTTGFYSEQFPGRQQLSYARAGVIDVTDAFADRESETRLKGFVGQEVNDIMQQMTYETLQTILKEGKNIFDIGSTKTSKTELYNNLKDLLQKTALKSRKAAEALIDKAKKVSEQEGNIAAEKYAPAIEKSNSLWKRITDNWEDLVEKHQEYLMSYNITFDENDEMNIQQEKGKDETYDGAEKIDNFRKANAAVKLLLSTIPIMRNGNLVYTSINGAKLLPTSEVYMAIINRTYAATNPDEMFKSLRQLAIDDENYRTLYKYITKQKFDDGDISYDVDNDYDVRLINSMWRLFNKQNPTVKNLYILDNGDVQVGDSNFTTAARQLADEFKNGVVSSVKNNTKYFEYSSLRKGYAPKVDKNGKAVIASEPTNTLEEQVKFLAKLGIEFNMAEVEQLDNTDKTRFSKAALGIKKSFTDLEVVSTLTGRTLSINGRLLDLATIQAKIENPEFDSVFYNVNGDATQTFIGVNALSNLHSFLSKLTNIDQLANTPYSYLLTDSFAQGSVLLGKMFDIAGDGSRIKDSQNLMESSWADGTINSSTGKKKQSNKLNYQERLIQELNMNVAGFYYNLVPGDASLEHMAYMGNAISTEALRKGYEDGGINTIFKNYFISELNLAREGRDVRKSKELRFFRSILDNYKSDLHDDIMEAEGTTEGVYEAFKDDINNAVDKYIKNKTVQFKNTLSAFEIITEDEENPNVWNLKNLSIGKTMNNNDLLNHLEMLQINFMIANIEFHKLLYSDPYQYKDELKRIKNFLSPRQSLAANSSKLNTAMNKVYNKGYKKGDVGYTDFTKDYFKTVTFADVVAIGDLPGYGSAEDEEGYKETDGSGIISLSAYRNFRIRSGDWNDAEERQYRFDIRYRAAFKAGAKPEQLIELLKQNPGVQSAYTPLKPIVSGNKANGKNYNDIVLDKFALYPSSFRVLHEMNPDSNAIKLYEKMETEEIDYVVFESGRKVGTQETFAPYDENDQFNNAAFTEEQIVNIPFSIMATQSEVPSKEDGLVTRGSQITKLVTLDFMQAGVPIDYKGDMADWIKLSDDAKKEASPIYKEINNNQLILEGMISLGFNNLLNSMGIKQVGEEFEVTDFSKAASTLRREVLKREVNDNISDALAGFLEGKVTLEATPAYQQIRNILYSIADREVISQKVGGGMKVQIPSTFFEEERIKSKDGKGYTSDVLKFYTNKEGQRVAEVMLARWFDIDMTDQQLLDYFNNTPEGQEILKGIGFRIPTQKQNSIDVIKIAKFLPKEFGDSVVVPSALVNKAGSDFDIDKLSVYLKNIYQNNKGEIKPIPFYGVGEKAINKLRDLNLDINIYDVYKRSLENGYFTSLENLISSEENFEPLTTPNSADQLKKLSGDIVSKLGIAKIDYADPGNMLDRRFMSRLRQAFISGKYAIGIAAVNQTNHSLNQRTNIFVDFDGMKGKLNQVDRDWLGDGKVKFKEYNTIEVNGKSYPSLSMIYNKANQRISDILSQFIDGYVDIAKGPWIIELGATPNTASTWMFLTKIGVPIDTIAYFMNQPIIRDYLRKIENAGYSWLFIDDFVKEIKTSPKYAVADNYNFSKITSIPSTTSLKETVGVTKFGNQDARAQQQFMLDEFLKYAKMASQMFTVTQGSNFDTATFNDPYLIFKKEQQLIKAQNTIIVSVDKNGKIIPGVNAILENSFLGVMAKRLQDVRNAYSKILTSDNKAIRNVIEKVLSPYTDMSDADFIKIAQKAVADLFDWAVQIDKKLNREVTDILLSDGNAASEINKFINTVRKNDNHKLYDNQVVKLLEQLPSSVRGGVNNMKIKNKTNKVYDQNEIINGFRELKTYLGEDPLYDKIVKLTVLQSGLSKSPISFTSLLPHEDFENIYNKTLSTLDKMSNLEDFYKLGVFQRNNWNNDDIVPYRKAKFKQDKNDKWFYSNALNMKDQTIEDAINIGRIPQLMKLSSLTRDSNKDYLVYSWEVGNKQEKAEMRKRGDYSYIKKALFKKVYDGTTPLAPKNFYGTPTYVYKQINAWGDGMKANEFYNVSRKSVIPNGFEEATEVQDDDILEYFTYDETTDSAKETATTAITTNEATELVEGKISLPRRETKKTKFTATLIDGRTIEKEGYRVIIPEYPNAEVYVSNEMVDQEGNTFKTKWTVEAGGFLVSNEFRSIDEAIADFQQKVNNIKSTEVLKKVQEATKIFVGDPQETLTLQDGRAYTKLEIDGKLLKKLGYTPEEIGNILNEIC
jgi:predicted kinase